MQTVSAQFLPSLATAHDVLTTLTFTNPITSVQTLVEIQDGQISLDVTNFVRRTLTVSGPNLESVFQLLNVPGGEIAVLSGIRYGTTTELVPAGVYRVDEAELTFSPSGQLQVTCPDRSVVVQRARMGANRSAVSSNTVWQEIQRLVEGSFTSTYATFPGWAQLDESVTTKVGAQVYDAGNRDAVIAQFCTDNSLEFFFDANGLAVLRLIPTVPGALGTWTTVMGANGVMIDGTRTRSLSDTKNVIVLTTTATDVQLSAVEVANTNSPLTDPLSSLGPLGRQVMDYPGNFRTTAQMTTAGQTLLARYSAVQQQLSVATVGNAALDGWDQITVVPLISDLGSRPSESHIVQSYTLPLTNRGQQSITGRAVITS